MICGFVINKFRGDISLFDDGVKAVTAHTGWPCFGVVPWLKEAGLLPAEDSVALDTQSAGTSVKSKIAVPVLDRISNFDDFDPLKAEPEIDLVFVRPGARIPDDAALIIIPGTKSTIADLAALRRNGWDTDIMRHHASGRPVLGVCGGYQMLGKEIGDPLGLEGRPSTVEGLGLLDIVTAMEPEKAVRNASGHSVPFGAPISGYEIHIGRTSGPDCSSAFSVNNGHPDGAISADGLVMGTYIHGLFGNDTFRRKFLARFGMNAQLSAYWAGVDAALDGIAAQLDKRGLGKILDAAR